MKDPNCPKFLESHVQKLKEAWEDTNEKAQKRKKELEGNDKFISVHLMIQNNLYYCFAIYELNTYIF